MMGTFISFFCVCTIAYFGFWWLHNLLSGGSDRVIYIGDCEGVPGYAQRKGPAGCWGILAIIIFVLAMLLLLL
ncbi:MAG: hypothetical protein IJT97_08650 [Bacteroidaceae bacterium]|nr:hypothetical protein [Bacteroidaceae bacterium]